jgi:ribosomal protein S27E
MEHENMPIEIACPECKHTKIIYLQKEDMPKCPKCNIRMGIREVLREGKSY